MTEHNDSLHLDENEQIAIRREKLSHLREKGEAYLNTYRRAHFVKDISGQFSELHKEALEEKQVHVNVAGRIMTRRLMGKASFVHIQDMSGKMQIYVQQNTVGQAVYEEFKKWDIGDIIGVEGYLFKTKTDELTLWAEKIILVTKALRPLPDKYHGLADTEVCYRKRYLDLIANEDSRLTFIARSKTVQAIREFLMQHQFLEVETPMMQVIPGGATARPFVTHHHALGIDMYLRVSPELYLKRLVVGGFERVFEINRNFRNEGLSTRHNPEFTMLEYYQAYADYEEAMDIMESMIRKVAQDVLGTLKVTYQGEEYDLETPFPRMTILEAILHYNSQWTKDELNDFATAKKIAESLGIQIKPTWGLGKVQIEIFEKTAEHQLKGPVFITQFPTEVSPLARANDSNPFVTDRFEFFLAGREVANGFSELNDPDDQAARFAKQVEEKEAGDEEAMFFDSDYIHALEQGMPPAAGVGIGIDRLVMFLTDKPSIRDVILFPHMRPED